MLPPVSSFEREMSAAVKDVERAVFLELIRSHPEMTLAELSKLSKGQFAGLLSSVTVGEVIRAGLEFDRASSPGLQRGSRPAGAGPSDDDDDDDDDGSDEEVNTRTAVGRREYDTRVLEFIQESEEPVSATEIRSAIGGTSLQVRKAVARLIETEKVTWQGKARGTRYSAI